MTETKLKSILKAELADAQGYIGDELSDQRARAMDDYYGRPYGNEVDGRSQIVVRDIADTIEWLLPQLLKPFIAGERMARYEPMGPEDKPAADQATDYANHIVTKDNPGFSILYSWFKDALIVKNGFIKVWWDERERVESERYSGLTEEEAGLILDDKAVTALNQWEEDGFLGLHVTRRAKQGRVRIDNVPPEQVLVTRKATSPREIPFIAHRVWRTRSELIEMGYSRSMVEDLPASLGAEGLYSQEFTARHDIDNTRSQFGENVLDDAMEKILLAECYLKVDWDDDGIAEWRKVCVAEESSFDILDNEAISEHPFVTITPTIMPHKFFGRSIADQIEDVQLIRTTVLRQVLDNMYNLNNNRLFVDYQHIVDQDELLVNRPNQIIRVDGDPSRIVRPMPNEPLGAYAFPLLEWLDQMRETRTGVIRYMQGLDPDSLNKTATGISMLTQAGLQRVELVARTLAETGVAELFRKILRIVVKHQDKPRLIRLRNEFVNMDPRAWNSDMDVSVEVGLGYGSKELQNVIIDQVLGVQQQIVQFQGGASGPLVTLKNIYHALEKKIEASGLKTVMPYFTDPDTAEPQQPRPDPKQAEAEAKITLQREETMARLQMEQHRTVAELKLKEQEMALKRELAQAEMALKREVAQADVGLKREQAQANFDLKSAVDLHEAAGNSGEHLTNPFGRLVNALEAVVAGQNQALALLSQAASQIAEASNTIALAATTPREIRRTSDGSYIARSLLQ